MAETDLQVLSANLRRLRAARGFSQVEAAEAAGLSRAAYRNLETGKSEPRERTLQRLADALGASMTDLLAPAPVLNGVRFRSHKRLKLREHILAEAGRLLSDYAQLEALLDDRRAFALQAEHSPADDEDKWPAQVAKRCRARLGLDESEPVRDICGLLQSCGVKVIALNVASDGFFGLSAADPPFGPAVVVNTWERISVERWIFSAAHELGHLLLHATAFRRSAVEEDAKEESQANEFASHFLLPPKSFAKEWMETEGMPLVDRVLKVKRIFRVSYAIVLYRLQQESGKKTLWQWFAADYKRQRGHSLTHHHEPDALDWDAFSVGAPEPTRAGEPDNLLSSDFVEDRRQRLVRKAIEEGIISLSRGAEILGLPLEQMRELSSLWVDVWRKAPTESRSS